MPVISIFFGIIIKMHYRDHNPPHFHAEYQGFHGFFSVSHGKLIAGEFPKKLQAVICEWTLLHKKELLKNWALALKKEPLIRIPGADQ
jgi:hypothetical protein